jgi:hypothetical protein
MLPERQRKFPELMAVSPCGQRRSQQDYGERRDKTGIEKEMEELHTEGVANHGDPE